MDSEGVRWNDLSLKGAALVQEEGFMMGGFSKLCITSYVTINKQFKVRRNYTINIAFNGP